ncbi:acyltransferase family protein [Bacteroides congonensis]|uniref:acyltransferase family protein n=1 Tax=Bacteroides congonensis TaxID=1871006 RepID=UPI0009336E8E
MRNLNGIDLLKFIMSIIIVGVHSCVFEMLANDYFGVLINNISNVCVSTFFVISSFFFFCKVRSLTTTKEKNRQLLMFEKRTLFLYLFWIVVQLPYMV